MPPDVEHALPLNLNEFFFLPEKKAPIIVRLNSTYFAEVSDNIKVGCTLFSHDVVAQLAQAIKDYNR